MPHTPRERHDRRGLWRRAQLAPQCTQPSHVGGAGRCGRAPASEVARGGHAHWGGEQGPHHHVHPARCPVRTALWCENRTRAPRAPRALAYPGREGGLGCAPQRPTNPDASRRGTTDRDAAWHPSPASPRREPTSESVHLPPGRPERVSGRAHPLATLAQSIALMNARPLCVERRARAGTRYWLSEMRGDLRR